MVTCNLRWSLLELAFIGACHTSAIVSVLRSDLRLSLEIVLIAAVTASFLHYLWGRSRTFYRLREGGLQRQKSALVLSSQFAEFHLRGDVGQTALPVVVYVSEFLLVLSFRPANPRHSNKLKYLVLWPDSLIRSEDRRLRRFLRYELGQDLLEI